MVGLKIKPLGIEIKKPSFIYPFPPRETYSFLLLHSAKQRITVAGLHYMQLGPWVIPVNSILNTKSQDYGNQLL